MAMNSFEYCAELEQIGTVITRFAHGVVSSYFLSEAPDGNAFRISANRSV
jgi:hypothetical protein